MSTPRIAAEVFAPPARGNDCSYAVDGVRLRVSAEPSVLDGIDEVYGPFRVPSTLDEPVVLSVTRSEGGYEVADRSGWSDLRESEDSAVACADGRLAELLVAELALHETYAIHAASLRTPSGALIVTGPSGAGKTTLALGLLARRLPLLSDEYALPEADGPTIRPFLRNILVRPGTPELVPFVGHLLNGPPRDRGVGPKWSIPPAELERMCPGSLSGPAPLRHVLFLAPRVSAAQALLEPVPPGIAAVELTRSTPAAVARFADVLARHSRLVDGCRIARLRPGTLESSIECVLSWLAADDG